MNKESLKEPTKINITHENINEIKSENIVAFSFASPGAQGEGGALYIGYKEKDFKMYYTNLYYCEDALLRDKILSGFFKPFLANAINLDIGDQIILEHLGFIPNYALEPLGLGNYLYIKDEYYDDFMALCHKVLKNELYSMGGFYLNKNKLMNLFFSNELQNE